MKIIPGLDRISPPLERSILTVGNFDGVHLAHQKLLTQASEFAAETNAPVVVLTFDPHPLTIVAPDKAPECLTPLDEKLDLLDQAGVEMVVVARSEPKLLQVEAQTFVQDILLTHFHPTHIVEGPSFGFGKGRKGTPALLKQYAEPSGCKVHIVEPVTLQLDEGEAVMVSSSLIRRLIVEGKVQQAVYCLGRPYAILSEVIKGDQRGRTLGFPTANLQKPEQLVPSEGVYSGSAFVGDNKYPCAISIGKTPTFDGDDILIEAHLLEFDGDLYGQPIRVEFHRRLRDQQKFDSPESLIKQLKCDVESVRNEFQ